MSSDKLFAATSVELSDLLGRCFLWPLDFIFVLIIRRYIFLVFYCGLLCFHGSLNKIIVMLYFLHTSLIISIFFKGNAFYKDIE